MVRLTEALSLDDKAQKEHFLGQMLAHDVLCTRNELLFGQMRKNKFIYKELVQLMSVLTKKEAFCRHLAQERPDLVLELFSNFHARSDENIISRFELAVVHDVLDCFPRSVLDNGARFGVNNRRQVP